MVTYLPLALLLLAGTAIATISRIVGGEETTIENYPALVQVDGLSSITGGWDHMCGASILTTRWLLSAAHCFDGALYTPEHRRIRAGSTYRNVGGVIHYVDYEINHPDWGVHFGSYDADIGVFKLLTALVYTPVIQRATIVEQNDMVPDNHPVVYAGWGAESMLSPASPVLQHVTVNVINHDVCAERYRSVFGVNIINDKMLCSGILDVGGKDSCSGDSGGPLYSDVARRVVVGIVSFGSCGNPSLPSVTASVAYFSDWIIANAR